MKKASKGGGFQRKGKRPSYAFTAAENQMLLIQELVTPVSIGLEADLTAKNQLF
jgi:hypothetical protein